MADLIHGVAMGFHVECRPVNRRRIRFVPQAFGTEVLRHGIGAPVLLEHHQTRRLGTIKHLWARSWALLFSAELDGPYAELGRRMILEGVRVSLAGLFGSRRRPNGNETATAMHVIEELSLIRRPAFASTWAALGKSADEPMRPFKWWRGDPPLPFDLSPELRARASARRARRLEEGHVETVLERISDRYDRIETALRRRS